MMKRRDRARKEKIRRSIGDLDLDKYGGICLAGTGGILVRNEKVFQNLKERSSLLFAFKEKHREVKITDWI